MSRDLLNGARRRPRPGFAALIVLLCCLLAAGVASAASGAGADFLGQDRAGQTLADGSTVLPDGQAVRPEGDRITELTNGRILSSTISPDGHYLAALTESRLLGGFLTVIDLATGKSIQTLGLSGAGAVAPFGDGSDAADGPFYSPDGKSLWWGQSKDLLRFSVNADGTLSNQPTATIKLPARYTAPPAVNAPVSSASGGTALPCGMAFTPDGATAYVALNGNDTVGVIDTKTNTLLRQIPLGGAPRQVVLQGQNLWVSNEGGRVANRRDVSNQTAYTPVVADPRTGAVNNGTVSLVDTRTNRQIRTYATGLEPTGLTLGYRSLLIANSGGDSFSVIDTQTRKLTRTVAVEPLAQSPVGNHVNSIAIVDRHHIVLSLGRDNALAEYEYSNPLTAPRYLGLIPTDYDPVKVAVARGQIIVTNGQGLGGRGSAGSATNGTGTGAYLTYFETSTLTRLAGLPDAARLAQDTAQVFANNGWSQRAAIDSGSVDPVPDVIPARLGLPSAIKHVFLIIRENRTYDQVNGDLGSGNGDPALAQFGQAVTPNGHALAQRFGNVDNFYDPGTLSADGHNWILQSDAPDYIESSFGTFARSYPASGADALAYQRSGFIWDRALAAGLTVRNYGEYDNYFSVPAKAPSWSEWYTDSRILEGKQSGPLPIPVRRYRSWTDVPSLAKVTDPYFPEFDLDVPDQYRVDVWDQEFKQQVATDTFPAFTLMTLICDHTGGTNGQPSPPAEVADNDLALGRIVDEVSHSKEWASTAIFVAEDDSQAGADHVDGHRAPMYVISPYSKPGVDSNYYDQPSMTRTIEMILGLKPMNNVDASAPPMYDAFQSTPNLAPYSAVSNMVPLTLGTTAAPSLGGLTAMRRQLAHGASPQVRAALRAALGGATAGELTLWQRRAAVPAPMRPVQRAWLRWAAQQHFGGQHPRPDVAAPALLSRYDWYTTHGWRVPYPGDPLIYRPSDVPAPLAGDTSDRAAADGPAR